MPTLSRVLIIIGCLSLMVAFLLSALGFHALGDVMVPGKKESWNWAVELQFYNSLGLVVLGLLATRLARTTLIALAGAIIVAGLFLFSGSIYLECLGAPEAVGEVAPIGGTGFMLAWFLVAVAVWRNGAAPRSS
jgi:uncharacterized membrane protein YgdD (TMEM256/DUF423 family)